MRGPANSRTEKAPIRPYAHLLWNAFWTHKQQVVIQIAFTIVLALIPAGQVILTRYTLDAIMKALSSKAIAPAISMLLLQGALGLVSTVLTERKRVHQSWLGEHLSLSLKQPLLNKVQELDLLRFEQSSYYDHYQRAQTALSRTVQAPEQVMATVQSVLTLIAYVAILWRTHWSLTVLVPIFGIPGLFSGFITAQRTLAITRGMTPVARLSAHLETLLTGRQAASEMRIYGLYRYISARFQDAYWESARDRQRIVNQQAKASIWVAIIDLLPSSVLSIIILWSTARSGATVGVYAATIQAMGGTQSAMENMMRQLSSWYGNALLMEDYFTFMALPSIPKPPAGGVITRVDSIQARNVSFIYPGRQEPALADVSLQARRGEIIAIVGENGSGKTTLAKCLMGMYSPTSGQVLFDEADVAKVPQAALYGVEAALFQDFVQFQMSLRENIGFGDIARLKDDAALWNAMRSARLDQMVTQLPNGLDSELGVMFGEGKELSLGQWQRVALARVFFKDAEVVLLDEPTAALDPQSELLMFRTVKEAYRGKKTVFLISHRLGICREADRIFVMKEGRLVESGSHDALMAMGGTYAEMFEMQAELYRTPTAP